MGRAHTALVAGKRDHYNRSGREQRRELVNDMPPMLPKKLPLGFITEASAATLAGLTPTALRHRHDRGHIAALVTQGDAYLYSERDVLSLAKGGVR